MENYFFYNLSEWIMLLITMLLITHWERNWERNSKCNIKTSADRSNFKKNGCSRSMPGSILYIPAKKLLNTIQSMSSKYYNSTIFDGITEVHAISHQRSDIY